MWQIGYNSQFTHTHTHSRSSTHLLGYRGWFDCERLTNLMSSCFASAKPMAKSMINRDSVTVPLPLPVKSQVTLHHTLFVNHPLGYREWLEREPTSAGLPRIHRSSISSVSIRWVTVDALTASLEGMRHLSPSVPRLESLHPLECLQSKRLDYINIHASSFHG